LGRKLLDAVAMKMQVSTRPCIREVIDGFHDNKISSGERQLCALELTGFPTLTQAGSGCALCAKMKYYFILAQHLN